MTQKHPIDELPLGVTLVTSCYYSTATPLTGLISLLTHMQGQHSGTRLFWYCCLDSETSLQDLPSPSMVGPIDGALLVQITAYIKPQLECCLDFSQEDEVRYGQPGEKYCALTRLTRHFLISSPANLPNLLTSMVFRTGIHPD